MSLTLLLPAVVVASGLVVLAMALSRVRDEARRLRRGIAGLSELTPALVEMSEAGEKLRRTTMGLRRS